MVEAGLLPLLVEATDAHADDPNFAEAALWVIHNVTVANSVHKNTLTR